MDCLELTYDLLIRKACPTLTFDHIGTNPIITSERPNTHIHQHGRHIYYHLWNGSAITSDLLVMRKAQNSHPSRLEHILLTMMEELCTSIQDGTHPTHNDERFSHFHPGWNTSCSQWWKTPIQAGTHPTHSDERFQHLHLSTWEHIPPLL